MSATRSSFRTVLMLMAAGLLAGYGAARAQAQDRTSRLPARNVSISLWEDATAGSTVTLRRATRLLGEPLKNTQGVRLGSIQDLVLTPDLDAVSYAVISRGGLFGFGNRLHAVPWSAMRAGVGDAIVAPIDAQELEQDPGFQANLWPSQGNPRWLSRAGERTEQVTYDVLRAAEQEEIRLRRASRILGLPARGLDNNRVGSVRDFVIATDSGDVPFAILSFGGLLGLGTRYTAVPAGAIEFQPERQVARVQVNEQILQANAFNPSHFPDLSDPVYARRLYSAYNVDPRDADWVVLGYVPPEAPVGARPTRPAPSPRAVPNQTQTRTPAQPQTGIAVQPQPTQPTQAPAPRGVPIPQTPGAESVRDQYLAAFASENLRTIDGVVTGVSSFQLVGTNAEWVQLQVRTDDGELVTVHLGPRDYVGRQDFYVAANDRISLTGAQATAWRQPIILPVTATVSGRTVNFRDRDGRPLWEQMTNTRQNEMQTMP